MVLHISKQHFKSNLSNLISMQLLCSRWVHSHFCQNLIFSFGSSFFFSFSPIPSSQSITLPQERRTRNKESSALEAPINKKTSTRFPLSFVQCLSHPKPKQRRVERNPTDALCVPSRSQKLLIWKFIFLFIPVKNRSAASSVNTNAHRLVTSRNTCWNIQERSLSRACSVSSPAHQLVTSKDTC